MPGLYAKPLANGQVVPVYLEDADAQAAGLKPYYAGAEQDKPPDWHMPPEQYASALDAYTNVMPDAARAAQQGEGGASAAGRGGSGGTRGTPPQGGGGGAEGQPSFEAPGGAGGSAEPMPEKSRGASAETASGLSEQPVSNLLGQAQPGLSFGQGYGRPRLVSPAHEARVGYQYSHPAGTPEGDIYALDQANKEFNAASATVAQNKADTSLYAAAELERENTRLAWQIQEEKDKRARIDAEIERRRYEVDVREKEAEQLSDATPEQFWKEKGVLGQLAASISIALGGYVQGARGMANNPGADLVNNTINMWIRGQKDKYERSRGRVDDAKNAYAEALHRWGTPEAAEADMRMRANAVSANMIKARLLKMGVPDQMAADNELIKARQAQQAKDKIALQSMLAGQMVEQYQLMQAQYAGGGRKLDQSQLVYLNGQPLGFAKNTDDYKQAQDSADSLTRMMGELDNTIAYLQDSSNKYSEKRARAKTLALFMAKQTEHDTGQGVLREGEMAPVLQQFGDPDALVNINGVARLQETKRYLRRLYLTKIRNRVVIDPNIPQSVLPPEADVKMNR